MAKENLKPGDNLGADEPLNPSPSELIIDVSEQLYTQTREKVIWKMGAERRAEETYASEQDPGRALDIRSKILSTAVWNQTEEERKREIDARTRYEIFKQAFNPPTELPPVGNAIKLFPIQTRTDAKQQTTVILH